VKKALFPLENINIKNFEPIIKVVERYYNRVNSRKNLDFIENNKKDEKKKEEDKNAGDGFVRKACYDRVQRRSFHSRTRSSISSSKTNSNCFILFSS
jgi:hypothetical protein